MVTEKDDVLDSYQISRGNLLLLPGLRQRLRQQVRIAAPFVAIGGNHVNNRLSLPGPPRHRPPDAKLRIGWMRRDDQKMNRLVLHDRPPYMLVFLPPRQDDHAGVRTPVSLSGPA